MFPTLSLWDHVMYSRDINGVSTRIVHTLIRVLLVPKEQGVLAFKEMLVQI